MCDEWGVLNFYIVLLLNKKWLVGLFLILIVLIFKLLVVFIKLVFLFDWNFMIGLWIVMNFCRVFIKEEEFIFLMILICILCVIRYVFCCFFGYNGLWIEYINFDIIKWLVWCEVLCWEIWYFLVFCFVLEFLVLYVVVKDGRYEMFFVCNLIICMLNGFFS